MKLSASSPNNEADESSNELDSTQNVTLTTGQVRGLLYKTATGRQAYVFFGIPYVEPPVGDLRFAKTVPVRPWNDTMDCTGGYKPACPQNISISQYAQQSEDCLYVNVFVSPNCLMPMRTNSTNQTSVPATNQSVSLCPVLYYVHGGANEFESPAMFPVDDLIDNIASQDIVLVTVAYRLGVLGFFSTGSDDVPGNWAIGDIIEGAKWVQREIENFGGSPSNVTVMGHSSSGTLVSLLTMTNKSESLFYRAVVMSGSGTVWNAIWNDVTDYRTLAGKMGCLNDDDNNRLEKNQSQIIVQCMRKVDPWVLVSEFNKLRGYEDNGITPLNITQVRNDGPDGFFPLPLKETIARRRPMDLLTGTTKYEDGPQKWLVKRGSPLTTIRKCSQIVRQNTNLKRKKRITKACVREYVSGVRPWEIFSGNRTMDPFSFWTDQTVAVQEDSEYFAPCAEEVSTMLHASDGVGTKVFLYSFDYEKTKLKGVYPWHAADVSFVLGSHKLDGKFDDNDLQIQKRYLPLFVNFVKYGDPTPTSIDGVRMPILTSENAKRPYPYLSVNIPLKVEKAYHRKADHFWNVIVPKLDVEKDFWPDERGLLYPINSDGSVMENFTWAQLVGNDSGKQRHVKSSNGSQYVKYEYGVTWPLYVIAILCFMMLIVPSSAYLMSAINRRRRGDDDASRPLLRTSGGAVYDNYEAL